ncbi:MAG: hypothetical protein FWF42_00730 [Streptococcaceae bacterium]|nr:hypothetical protein [Streptococcaceae bacterium]MCL2681454.1 hypothetical protein [Streptococcaceae bacterium]MCL2858193.1 hypothetical protein [Streptococcaceae bacterium]
MSIKKIIVGTVAGLSFLAPVAVSATSVAQSQQVTPTTSQVNAQQVSQSFINKYDKAVKLVKGQFVIDHKALPKGTSHADLKKLQDLVAQSNVPLKTSLQQAPKANVAITGNSVVIGATGHDAKVASGQILQPDSRSWFHEGSNYCHVYWWGARIGISKSTLRGVGSHAAWAIGAVAGLLKLVGKLPAAPAKVAEVVGYLAGVVGYGLQNFPGGIVFNLSVVPGFGLQVWGVGFQ